MDTSPSKIVNNYCNSSEIQIKSKLNLYKIQ